MQLKIYQENVISVPLEKAKQKVGELVEEKFLFFFTLASFGSSVIEK